MTADAETGPQSFAVHLPYDDSAAATARRLVSQLLAGLDHPAELIGDATLVVHELVINGLIHGEPDEHGHLEVTGRLGDGLLVISVRDHGHRGTVAAQPFTPDGASGRGLSMVDRLVTSWSVDRSAGTLVSACWELGA